MRVRSDLKCRAAPTLLHSLCCVAAGQQHQARYSVPQRLWPAAHGPGVHGRAPGAVHCCPRVLSLAPVARCSSGTGPCSLLCMSDVQLHGHPLSSWQASARLQGILKPADRAPAAVGSDEDEEAQQGGQREVDQHRLRLYEQAKLRCRAAAAALPAQMSCPVLCCNTSGPVAWVHAAGTFTRSWSATAWPLPLPCIRTVMAWTLNTQHAGVDGHKVLP